MINMERKLIKVQDIFGDIFNVYYEPKSLCWIQEGTSFYYDDEDWANKVIKKI